MGKNVAVFVDVANIFYAAKAAGVDIDYVTLLKASSAGRDLVRAYAYTGLDPDNENQRNFHEFLRRSGYKVVSKDIRKYGDGKVKANLDIELVVDMMKTARNLDVAIVVSGDGDFAPAIRAVQEQGVRVEVVSFRGNTSSDLMDVADLFTDITQIAKVEKGSSRSGRRVAAADDLSMTEVPDKQSEGTGERSRGRGRTRRTTTGTTTTTRGRGRAAAAPAGDGADTPLIVLPGEKLSRVAAGAPEREPEDGAMDAGPELESDDGALERVADDGTEDGRRRRRRRGGRGRGRGRGRDEAGFVEGEPAERSATGSDLSDEDADDGEAEGDVAPAPARRPVSAFGSVWDSQIGITASRSAPLVDDDEDLEEPAVPEYLLAERRGRDAGRGGMRGGRGRGGAYAAALDRERFGGGRGSTPSRFGEPPPRREGSFGRPDRPDRPERQDRQERQERGDRRDRPPFRQAPRPAPRPSGDEPWSEVPPEIEAMLRAQIGSRPAAEPRREAPPPSSDAQEPSTTPSAAAGRGRGRRTAKVVDEPGILASASETSGAAEAAAPARRPTARRSRAAATPDTSPDESPTSTPVAARRSTGGRTSTRTPAKAAGKKPSKTSAAVESTDGASEAAAPKRRTVRKKADPSA